MLVINHIICYGDWGQKDDIRWEGDEKAPKRMTEFVNGHLTDSSISKPIKVTFGNLVSLTYFKFKYILTFLILKIG